MPTPTKEQIESTLRKARRTLYVGLSLAFLIPFLILLLGPSLMAYFGFSEVTGQIGDTLGGITAPIVNLTGSYLIYNALKAQIQANQLIQEQIDLDNISKELEKETQNLYQLYNHLNESISNFKFKRLAALINKDRYDHLHAVELIDNVNYMNSINPTEKSGAEAFYCMLGEILCDYHGTKEALQEDPCVSEFYSILLIMKLLIQKLNSSKSNNKEILKTLVGHQFQYKLITRIKYLGNENLSVSYCDNCQCEHGIPSDLLELILDIRSEFTDSF